MVVIVFAREVMRKFLCRQNLWGNIMGDTICIYTVHFVEFFNFRNIMGNNRLVKRACLITLHSNFEIFQKGHPAVEVILDRRIFER